MRKYISGNGRYGEVEKYLLLQPDWDRTCPKHHVLYVWKQTILWLPRAAKSWRLEEVKDARVCPVCLRLDRYLTQYYISSFRNYKRRPQRVNCMGALVGVAPPLK